MHNRHVSPTPAGTRPAFLALAALAGLFIASLANLTAQTANAASAPSPASNSKSTEDEAVVLPTFVVSTDKDRGYLSTNASSGAKLNQSLQEIPSTLSIINQELIRDTGAETVQELLRYAPGVQTSGNKSEDVQVRGFTLAVPLLDGFREPQGVPSEQVHIERVEILQGPAGILYGNTFGLGGIVNRISKKPNFHDPVQELFVQVRDHDYYQASLDFGRPMGDKFAYRLITNNVTSDDFQDFVSLQRVYFRPAVEWRPGKTTTARLTFEYGDQKAHPAYNADFWNDITNSLVKLPQKFNPGEDTFLEKTRRRALNFDLTQQLGRQWLLHNGLQLTRHYEDKGGTSFGVVQNGTLVGASALAGFFGAIEGPDGSLVPVSALPADAFWLLRNPSLTDRIVGNYFDQLDLAGTFETGGIKHTLTLGVEGTVDVDAYSLTYAMQSSIDLADRSYDALARQYGDPYNTAIYVGHIRTETVYWAGYISDSVKLFNDRLGANLALRYDDYQQKTDLQYGPALGGAHSLTNFYAKPHYMPRGGLVYNLTSNISAYAGFSEAYIIATNVNPDGSQAKPELGRQSEVGLKAVLLDGRASVNVSAFKLKRENIVESDPTRPGFFRQIGAQESQGFEVSGVAVVSKNLQVLGSYSYATGETQDSTDTTRVGLPLQAQPRHQAKGFGKYSFTEGALKGFGVGAGFNWAADRHVWTNGSIATRNFPKLPDAIVWDAAAFYQVNAALSVSLNVRNVFDKLYYTGADQAAWQRGTPRGVVFSAHYKF